MESKDRLEELAALLELERLEEEARGREALAGRSARQLQADGLCLLGLVVEDTRASGAEERLEAVLRRADGLELPFHCLRVGSRVVLSAREADGEEGVAGTVAEVAPAQITVSLDREPAGDLLRCSLTATLTSDDVTLQRMQQALRAVAEVREGRLKELRKVVVLGERPADFDVTAGQVAEWLDAGLDDSQKQAVEHALSARHVALIHGPPGTGKTRTAVEVIRQSLLREQRVLATAPSNIAVDNLLERMAAAGVAVLRIGHPARMRAHLRKHGFDERVTAAVDPEVSRHLRAEERSLQAQLGRAQRGFRELREQLRDVCRDLRTLHRDARSRVLEDAQVVLATCAGAASQLLARERFDLVVIDEAAQCLEPLAYVPMQKAPRLVMAGDHQQLPPTVLSAEAERKGLGRSLFERVAARADSAAADHPARMLRVQYRMHRLLMDFLSDLLYDGRLEAHPSVAEHTLPGLPPLLFVDTAGTGFDDRRHGEGESHENPGEARLLVEHLRERVLAAAGLTAADVAVITPYSGQVELLRRELAGLQGLEVDTVDGFQGREKEAVLVSLVRSNPEGEIGFLADIRRMNVAMSRARRHLWVTGDSATLARHPFYAAFSAYCEEQGAYDSAWSYL